jgi:hypothetical protein
LAEARRKKEAEEGGSKRESGSDWLGGLRSDAPPPEDYATGMDEDDEVDAGLSAALRQAQEEEDADLFAGVEPAPALSEPALPDFEPASPMFSPEERFNLPPLSAPQAEPSGEGLPDWLLTLSGEPAAESSPHFAAESLPALPDLPIQPFGSEPAAPAQPAASTGGDNTPDWLLDLSATPSSPSMTDEVIPPPIASPGVESATGELPDWLQDLKGAPPAKFEAPQEQAPANEVPGWLRSSTDSLPAPARPTFGDIDVEERLSFAFDEPMPSPPLTDDLNPLIGSADVPTRPTTSGFARRSLSITDLLGRTAGVESPSIQDEPTRPIPPNLGQTDENDLVPWLRGLQPPTLEPPVQAAPDLPDFLLSTPALPNLPDIPAPMPDIPAPVAEEPELPDFLRDLEPAEPAPQAEPVSAVEPDYPSHLVPWLQGLRPPPLEEAEAEAATPATPEPLLPAVPAPEPVIPPPAPRPVQPESDTSISRTFSFREMLRATNELSDSLENEQVIPPAFEDFEPEKPAQPELPAAPGSVESEEETTSRASLPPWLNASAEAAAPPVAPAFPPSPTPSFLFGDEEEEETEMLPFAPPAFDGAPALPSNQPSLASIGGGAPPDLQLADFLSDTPATPAAASSSEENLPDFFKEMSQAAPPASDLPSTSAGEPDLPDFLRDMAGPSPATPAAEPELPDFLREMASPAAPSGSLPEAEPNPDFLASLGIEPVGGTEESLPDWATPPPAAPTAQGGEGLDFLRSEAAAMAAEPEEEAPMPDWLAALSSGQAPVVAPKASTGYSPMSMGTSRAEEQQTELPSWLQEAGAVEAAPVAPAPSAPVEEAALPADFFGQAATPEAPTPVKPPEAPPASRGFQINTDELPDAAQLPDWLSETPAAPAEPEFVLPAKLPEWLDENDANAVPLALEDLTAEEPASSPEAATPPAFESNLDDVITNVPGRFSGANFLGDIEGPAWLRSSGQPKTVKPDTGALASAEASQEPLVPSWLRTVAAQPVEEEEVAPAAPVLFQEPDENLPQVTLPPQLASAAVLSTLLVPATAITIATEEEAPSRLPFKLPSAQLVRYGLYILLALVTGLALLATPRIDSLTITPAVQTFYDQVDSLAPNSKVLISYDWEADRSGEMKPLAQAVTQHIMAKRARLVTISLNPQGPALASQVTDELATNPNYGNNSFYSYGRNYLNLGWRTGNEAAVRGLFSNMGGLTDYKNLQRAGDTQAMQGINSLADFDLVIVLAGDEGSVRTWVEQFGIQPGSGLLFGVPSAVEPLARPYAQGLPSADPNLRTTEKQVRARAMLAGLSGTAQYDQLLRDKLNLITDQNLSLASRLSAQSLAALLLVLIVLVANVVYLLRRRE